MAGKKLAKVHTFAALSPVPEDQDGMFSKDELTDSMGPKGFGPGDLERIKVPSGGSISWELEATDETKRKLEVVILAAHDIRMFYNKKYKGGNEAPDCISLDLKMGVIGDDCPEEVTGECATCPKAVWGSAVDDDGNPTDGQACKERKVMLIIQPNDSFPFILSAPSGSLKSVQKYFGRVVSAHGAPHWGVVTNLGLTKAKSGSGISYSVIDPEFVRMLTTDEVAAVRRLRDAFVPSLERRSPEPKDAD